jgi:transposase
MDIFPLATEARQDVENVFRTTSDANQRTRCHIVLLYDDGRRVEDLVDIFKVCERTVYRALTRYRAGGMAALADRPHPGPQKQYQPEDEELLVETVRQSPRTLGLDFSNWSLPTLAEYISERTGRHMGRHAVADILHAYKINMRRPKIKVTSPDPDYTEKRGS